MQAFGLTFPNPVGLAAGYDKEGWAIPGWPAWALAISRSARSPRARSRATPSRASSACRPTQAVINRMGFPSRGAAAAAAHLRRLGIQAGRFRGTVLGVNMGKNKATPLEERRG